MKTREEKTEKGSELCGEGDGWEKTQQEDMKRTREMDERKRK